MKKPRALKNISRRQPKFVALAAILLFASVGVIMLITSQAAAVVTSVKSGNWSDPSVWSGNKLPAAGDIVTIGSHSITYNVPNAQIGKLTLGDNGRLTFNPGQSATLEATGNIIIEGDLVMKPTSPSITHTIRFVGIDESKFSDGGGLNPLESDVGVWVMGAGKLDLVGAEKTPWTRAAGSIAQGANTITLEKVPSGWRVGDEIAVAPTKPPGDNKDPSWNVEGFDEATITAISGATVTLNKPTAHFHPAVNNTWKAEVMNLTRNVRIEGTATGRTHVFIRSTVPQTMRYVGTRYIGPRKVQPKNNNKFREDSEILGRWGIHFHFMHENSRGSLVEGTLVRDSGSRAFVAHASHGVIFRGAMVYNTIEHAFWWDDNKTAQQDGENDTNDTIWEDSVAARIYRGTGDVGVSGFYMGRGSGNTLRNVVVVGSEDSGVSRPGACCGGDWDTSGVLSHNNKGAGWDTYTNQNLPTQVVNGISAYHNVTGIRHGAYVNRFVYHNFNLYGNRDSGLEMHATSKEGDGIIHFTNGVIDSGGITIFGAFDDDHPRGSIEGQTTILKNITFRNFTGSGEFEEKTVPRAAIGVVNDNNNKAGYIDMVDNTYTNANPLWFADAIASDQEVRFSDSVNGIIAVHRKDKAGTLVPAWNAKKASIAPFADGLPEPDLDPDPRTDPPPAIEGDLNDDGRVDIVDLSIILSLYGSDDAGADLDRSGRVDITDLSILLSQFGK